MTRYDGEARQLLHDGSIEIVGSRSVSAAAFVLSFIVLWASGIILARWWPDVFPILYGLGLLAMVALSRSATRRLRFDAGARALVIVDRGRGAGERSIPFSGIRSLRIEQREPRRIARAPPVLTVNGEELLSVMDTYANAGFERELQALVGLPVQPTPRDTDGWAGP